MVQVPQSLSQAPSGWPSRLSTQRLSLGDDLEDLEDLGGRGGLGGLEDLEEVRVEVPLMVQEVLHRQMTNTTCQNCGEG
jgi:hypothetical protein